MSKVARVFGLVLAGVMAIGLGSGIRAAWAASGASLVVERAGCESFDVALSFHGTVDELGGYDYVRLRVVDSHGVLLYRSEPLGALYGETQSFAFTGVYTRPPTTAPLLFVLEDYEPLGQRRLESLATQVVLPDCDLPLRDPDAGLTTCAVRLRMGPGLNFRWRGFLPEGTSFTVIGRLYDSTWLQVRVDEDGRLGWIYDGTCVPGSPPQGTYAAAPVTFFRTPDEILLYEARQP